MKLRRAFFALCFGLGVYGLFSLLFGASGLFTYRLLREEQKRLEENIAKLRTINESLADDLAALRGDPEVIAVLARELGFARSNEKFVRISGLPLAARQSFQVGEKLSIAYPPAIPPKQLRLIALFAGLVYWVLSWARRGAASGQTRNVRFFGK